jgi:hypothetical protein
MRKQAKVNAKREWHTKFAWLPTSVDENRETHSRVWFEKYWRQGHYSSRSRPITFGTSPLEFTKFSEKEYFKKKLAGDFDKGEPDTGETSMASAQSVGRALRSPTAKPSISFAASPDTGISKK